MADCEFLAECRFLCEQMSTMPGAAAVMRRHYCHGDFAQCARHLVASRVGAAAVTPDLFPHLLDEAAELVSRASQRPS